MDKFINDTILPPVMKFVSTKAVMALRNGMLFTMPFTIIGSVFLLLANLPIEFLSNIISNSGLDVYFNQAFGASFAIMAFFAVMGITISYCRETGMELAESIPAGFVALTNFILLQANQVVYMIEETNVPITITNVIDKTWAGGSGMFASIVIGLGTGIAYSWFINRGIKIKMPDGVPGNISATFEALIPAFVSITGTMILFAIFDSFIGSTFFEWIYEVLQAPVQGMSDSLGGALMIGFLIPLFWFFGIHGSQIVMGIMGPITTANALNNQAILDSGLELTVANGGSVVTTQFVDQFMTVTGAGMTIGIVIFMVALSKSKQFKTLGRLSIVPAIFNINEPVLFATPVVMNPIMFLPFVTAPLLSALITYGALASGLVPLFSAVQVPWTTPPIISGLLVGGWQAALLQVVVLSVSIVVYLPFVKKMDMITLAQEQGQMSETVQATSA